MSVLKLESKKREFPCESFEILDESDRTFYVEGRFHHLLRAERQRTERSQRPFLLMLLDMNSPDKQLLHEENVHKIKAALASALRVEDIRGWYDRNGIIGVIVTEMKSADDYVINDILDKIWKRLSERLQKGLLEKIKVSLHVYPERRENGSSEVPYDMKLYPELTKRDSGYRAAQIVKKMIDFAVSSIAVLCFSPLFLLVAVAIKCSSPGPVFFKQQRLGYNGKMFSMLKFRSMYVDSASDSHREYIKKYIGDQKNAAVEPGVFKLTDDSRITPLGKLLRKTSLDELPQLLNVLKGEMSLVGPRPPLSYECDLYESWHMKRLLASKPGITGLWQVTGRSSTTFDEMVRLDLKYISEWSLWLDFKILLKTPKAVLRGVGAY